MKRKRGPRRGRKAGIKRKGPKIPYHEAEMGVASGNQVRGYILRIKKQAEFL
jgi:hypothetical protein